MPSVTLGTIRSKIKTELDLNEETWITDASINLYINDAIRDCEGKIHSLYEDYYLSSANVALVTGTSSYDLPSDTYADKIRLLQYNDGSTKYNIERIRQIDKIPFVQDNDFYTYIITNTAAAGHKIKIYPNSRETSSTNVTVWYIRNAKELTLDADICDIPEFINYVYAKVKLSIYLQEGNPMAQEAQSGVQLLEQEMIETLANRIPDDDNIIIPDSSFYDDFDNNGRF